MSVNLDVAGSEDDAIAGNFLVLPQVDNVSHLLKKEMSNMENARTTLLSFVINSMSVCLKN